MYYVHSNFKWGSKIEKAIDLIFPMSTYCIICGSYVDNTRKYSLCDTCIRRMRFGRIEIDLDKESEKEKRERVLNNSISCMNYGLLEKEIGLGLKYRGETYLARIIAEIMYDRIMNDPELNSDYLSCDIIVPVPISPDRRKMRGFNQSEKIGKYLSKKISMPMDSATLYRNRDTKALAKAKGDERYDVLDGAFSLKDDSLRGKSILLLDDFYTTGLTSYFIGKLLKENGIKEIHMITLATKNKYAKGYFK